MKKTILGLLLCVAFGTAKGAGKECSGCADGVSPVESSSDWNDKTYGSYTYEEYRKKVIEWCEKSSGYKTYVNEHQLLKKFFDGEIGAVPPLSYGYCMRVGGLDSPF